MSIDRISFVERKLGVKLPHDYAKFLTEYGDYEWRGIEIYGYNEYYIDINKIPCVIGATRLYKTDYNLKDNFIVISHTGYEDWIVILDTSSGEVFEMAADGTINRRFKNFSFWFNEFIG